MPLRTASFQDHVHSNSPCRCRRTSRRHQRHSYLSKKSTIFLSLLSFWLGHHDHHHHVSAAASITGPGNHASPKPHLQRGKVLSKHITAQELYQAYKDTQRDYLEKAFSASKNGWKILSEKDGVVVSVMHHPSDPSCPYVQMKAVFPTSVQECWEFLSLDRWDETMKVMDPFYEGVSIEGEFHHKGAEILLARKTTKGMLAFGKRDFSFISVSDKPLSDGTWVSGTVSVITDAIPRRRDYTRAYQDSIAFYKPISDHSTEMRIVCRIDLNDHSCIDGGGGGHMPMWLYVKTIGTTGTLSVINMRNALMQQVNERLAAKRERLFHQRLHREALPWMEWPTKHEEPSAAMARPAGKEKKTNKPALFGIVWDKIEPREEGKEEGTEGIEPLLESLPIQLRHSILPWMEWPDRKKIHKQRRKDKTLKQKLHEQALPWLEFPSKNENE